MHFNDKISTFSLWGKRINEQLSLLPTISADLLPESSTYDLSEVPLWHAILTAYFRNNWFTPYHSYLAIKNCTTAFLNEEKLKAWWSAYEQHPPLSANKRIGITMAGNLPLVGFHDLLCVWMTGASAVVKLSSKDAVLLPYLLELLFELEPEFRNRIEFTENLMKGCDAYIATGSDNSARYFDYYFGKYPHIIRQNRTSVALLDGTETTEELALLCDDIFLYFGLGCRNVSKLIVPLNYDFQPLLAASEKYHYFNQIMKYKNNFDYQLTLLLMNRIAHWKNDHFLIAPSDAIHAPISLVYYTEQAAPKAYLETLPDSKIQCIVGHGFQAFGSAQYPKLSDYADQIDTIQLLYQLN